MISKLKQYFKPPVFEEPGKTLMAHSAYHFALMGTSLSFVISILFFVLSPGNLFRNIVIAFSVFVGLVELYLLRKGHVRVAILVQSLIIWVSVVVASFSNGGLNSVGFVGGTIASMLVMGVAMSRRSTFAFLFSSITVASILAWREARGFISISHIEDTPLLNVVSYAAFIIILSGLLNMTYQSVTRSLAKAHKEIIERKRVEEELRQLNEELDQRVMQRTSELEALNKELEAFSYSVSHDLRTPLRSIIGYSQLIQMQSTEGDGSEVYELAQKVISSGKHMNYLIEAMLDLSRLNQTALHLSVVKPAEIVQSVIHDCEVDIRERKIHWEITDLPKVKADAVLLHQVYANLVGNAVKYTRHCKQAYIEIGSHLIDGQCIYFVKDNGAGFDMRYAERLFGYFQRMHRQDEFPGIGIGLAIVKRIILHHNGRIWAEAEPDQGATFYFTIGTENVTHLDPMV